MVDKLGGGIQLNADKHTKQIALHRSAVAARATATGTVKTFQNSLRSPPLPRDRLVEYAGTVCRKIFRQPRKWTKSQGKEVQQPHPKHPKPEPQEMKSPPQKATDPRPNIPLVRIDVNLTQLPLPSLLDIDIEPV